MNGTAAARDAFPEIQAALAPLVRLSARMGRDPLLGQASSGNTSIKLDGALWIKASGKWMADADREQMFVPVSLAEARECLLRELDPAERYPGASLETAMHAL